MTKLYNFTLLIILLTSPIFSVANNSKQETDSILSIVYNSQKSEQLQLLNKYIDLYPTNLALIKALDTEAAKEENQLYLAVAKRKYVYYYGTVGNRDSMKYYLDQTNNHLLEFVRRGGQKKIDDKDKESYQRSKVLVVASKATMYIDEGKYNLALNEISKGMNDPFIRDTKSFRSQANNLTGIAYLYTKKPAEALENFKKAYELELEAERKNKAENNNTHIGKYRYYTPMEGTVIAYNSLKKYEEAAAIADSLKSKLDKEYRQVKTLKETNANDEFLYNFFKNRILCYSALSNIHLKNTKTARQELDQVKDFTTAISKDAIHQDFEIYYLVEIEYYLATGNYDTAKKYATSLTDIVTADKHTYAYMQSHILLSKVLSAEGRNKEAYNMISDLYNVNDSINSVNFSKEFAEMESRYLLSEAKLQITEADLRWKNAQKVFFILALSLILSTAIAVIIWRNKKLLKEKNKVLYKQYKEIELRNIEILKLQAIQMPVEKEAAEIKLDQQDTIIDALDRYLMESQAFLDTKVSRESVAVKIGTNRQYLIQAIKDKTGKTFSEYIYSYRIKYAYELIVNHKNKTISDILQESGFHSRATFYNVFKEVYGMTPSELRDILKEKDKDRK